MSFLHRVKQAAEHLFFPRWGWGGSLYMGLPRTRYNYAADLGDGLGSSVLMGVVQWGMRTFPEAPLVVRQQQGTTLEIRPGHPLARLVARPNDAYPGEQLWMVSYWSWCVFGNVYWRVVHTTGDRPVQLWWVPPWQMEPQWPSDGSRFLSHYRYTPGTGPGMDLGLNEVIHIRHGLHPHNPRLGLSPLWSAVREVWGDDEASNWVASLLRNSAVPSVIITPSGDFPVETGDLEEIKAYLKENFTGDGRGEPLALQSPADVHRLGFNPSELDLSAVRDTAEERVCALLGIPAAVVGFGTGIQHTRVGATMHEQVGLAWNNGIIPVHRIMDAEVGRVLLPQIERQPDRFVVGREYSEVKALQEDRTALFTRANMGVTGGWMRVDQAKTMVGLMPEPGDAVYLRSFAMIEVGPDARRVAPPGLPLPEGQEPSRDDDPEKGAKGRKQAPRVDSPPAVLLRLVARLERESILQQMVFADEVTAELEALGEQAASAAQTVLAPKQAADDAMDAARILEGMDMLQARGLMQRLYERHYSRVATSVFTLVGEQLGLETDIPDPVMRSIVATGGRRAGLLDLDTQARESLFTALTEGRAAGEGVDALVQRIREQIPAGPWRDSQTRARVIARTETRFAQNISTVTRARDVDHIQHVMIFDARLGPTDEECDALAGQIVTLEEARTLADLEHPNGTRSFAPVPDLLLEEMGVTR